MMTVQELIDALQKIEDKSLPVCLGDADDDGDRPLIDADNIRCLSGDYYGYYDDKYITIKGPHIVLG